MDIHRFCGQLNEKPRTVGTMLICFFKVLHEKIGRLIPFMPVGSV